KTLRAMYEDVESITAEGDKDVLFKFRRPSSLIAESFIDVPIRRGDGSAAGTGPFAVQAGSGATKTEMVAFDGYYQQRPTIGKIVFSTYPNVRAAWADMLRDQLDMLYEVSADALDSMRGATNVALYSFDRPFQYLVFLNPSNPKLKAPAVRRALNAAIDRKAI